MLQQATPDDATLVRPPAKTPIDGTQPIPGSLPPAGAGSTAPLPAPTGYPEISPIPFGNGVNPMPVLKMAPSGPIGDPMVDPGTITGATGGSSSPVPANLGGTAILPGQQSPFTATPYQPTDISPMTINDPRLSKYNGLLDDTVGSLGNTDRRSMLQSLLNDFDSSQLENDSRLMDLSGRRSAALGRIGSGMAAQDINQITRQSLADRAKFRNTLAADTIDKEIGDRFQKAGLFSSLGNEIYSRGANDRNFDYGVQRDNESARRYADSTNYDRGRYADETAYNRSADARAEARGERSYQDSREAYDTDRRVEAAKLQDYLTGSAFDRSQQRLAAGQYSNPTSVYQGAAGDFQDQSDQTIALLMQYLQSMGIGAGSR